ncbi:hypothetical protein JYB88_05935 [Shewanella cyperi]|uniref:Uncharacterized protein n=1 Tax=Shewanella cyperi TaxID=2814292 RepID=A0A974XMK1_9GAMM|nr:hypothetical protein [Shewanella cyperi]QSX31177.1 hypothetical protein JYB88_05935 [Shewanella cyperi]
MYKFILLLLVLSLDATACGDKTEELHPFAIEETFDEEVQDNLKSFRILSPIHKGESFLSGIMAEVRNEFLVYLDIHEDYEYEGEYYYSYLTVADKYLNNVRITLYYDTPTKDRSVMSFCGNSKMYMLTELAEIAPAPQSLLRLEPR